MPEIRTFPYRRDIRPSFDEGLGQFIDREYEKIESAFVFLIDTINALEQRVAALEATP